MVSQYLSGTQTRRIAALVAQYPEPLCEIHPNLAGPLGIADGDLVTVTSRRGSITVPAQVVNTIRPDTVFIPYHWPGGKAANQLTIRAVDPISKMPEFKVAAVRVERAGGDVNITDGRDMELQGELPQLGIETIRVPSSDQVAVSAAACVQPSECGTTGQSHPPLNGSSCRHHSDADVVCGKIRIFRPRSGLSQLIKQTREGTVQWRLRCIGSNWVSSPAFGLLVATSTR